MPPTMAARGMHYNAFYDEPVNTGRYHCAERSSSQSLRSSSCTVRKASKNCAQDNVVQDNRSLHSDSGIDIVSSSTTLTSPYTDNIDLPKIVDDGCYTDRQTKRRNSKTNSIRGSTGSLSSEEERAHSSSQPLPQWIMELSLPTNDAVIRSSDQFSGPISSDCAVALEQEHSINNTTVEFVLDEVEALLKHGVSPPCVSDTSHEDAGETKRLQTLTPIVTYEFDVQVRDAENAAHRTKSIACSETMHVAHAAGGSSLVQNDAVAVTDYSASATIKRPKKTSRDILKYLDEVERYDRTHKTVLTCLSDDDDDDDDGKNNDALAQATARHSSKRPNFRKTDDFSLTAGTVRRKQRDTIAGGGELSGGKEHSKLVRQLQRELKRQLELTAKFAKDAEHEMKTRLKLQKDDYERDIKRHLAFVDQLIEDKRVLSDKSEALLKEAKIGERKALERIKAMEERHAVEVKRVREMFAASEKVKREKWIDEKTKQIKEATVRSLEHEIQKMIAQHKAELRKQKAMLKAELMETDERASRRFVSEVERIKDEHAREREQLMVSERELARRRVESLEDEWSRRFNDTNARHSQEITDLVGKYDKQLQDKDDQRKQLDAELREHHEKELTRQQKHFSFQLEELHEQHQLELRRALEQREFEFHKRLLEIEQKHENSLLEHLKQAREEMKCDRDREIEAILERLEQESSAAKHEWEQASEQRLKRMADGNQRAVTELETALRAANDKWCQEKMRITELESERVRLQVELKERAIELSDIGKIVNRMSTERQNLAQIIRNEFNERLQELENENRALKKDVNASRAQHKFDTERLSDRLEEMTRTHELEMNELHERVQATVDRKDRNVEELEEQLKCSAQRADHLEQMLEQQRKHLAQHGTNGKTDKHSSATSHNNHNATSR